MFGEKDEGFEETVGGVHVAQVGGQVCMLPHTRLVVRAPREFQIRGPLQIPQ